VGIIGSQALALRPPTPGDISVDVPLELFGGLLTEMSSADIPEGASPFCQDVDFELGQVFTRAGLTALFAGQITGSVNYVKTFTLPNGDNQLLLLDSSGKFYFEDTSHNPGTLVLIGTVLPGMLAQSVTQFGREYIAFSDGQLGIDIPRQWDGVNFDRVSQDGPGASPGSVTDFAGGIVISTITQSQNPVLPTFGVFYNWRSGNPLPGFGAVYVTDANNTTLAVGDQFFLTVPAHASVNGTYIISALFPNDNGGGNTAITFAPITPEIFHDGAMVGTYQDTQAIITTASAATFVAGQAVTIAGTTVGGYNVTWTVESVISPMQFTIEPLTILADATGGTIAAAGSGVISVGVHKCVVMFLTRQGYITKPSPPVSWTATTGNTGAQVTDIPIGPANVVARILAFTAAGGAFYFWIPQDTTGSLATIIRDNTTTTAVVNFSDVTLLAAASIDQIGSDLFSLVVLKESAGVISYADRMFWWGELNSQENFLNMGFDGGFTQSVPGTPLGWTLDVTNGAGGSKEAADVVWGFAYKVTGDGATVIRGLISQSAYRDYLSVAILSPETEYGIRFRAKQSGATQGNLVVEIFSATAGSLGTFSTIIAAISTARYQRLSGTLMTSHTTIPADAVLRVYTNGTLNNGAFILLDEMEIYPTLVPNNTTLLRASYIINPESFSGVTGVIGVSQLNGEAVRRTFKLRDNFYIQKEGSWFSTSDNGTSEPDGWQVNTISLKVGACSVNSGVGGEEWDVSASEKGVYLFNGSEPIKISQEIQPTWDGINFAAKNTIWMANDVAQRRIFIGIPRILDVVPSYVLMMNYRELNESSALASQGPVHISTSARMISWDMSRKWSPWNVFANCGAICADSTGGTRILFGQNLFNGKLYELNANATSDDGAPINSIYNTFFFVTREMEQGMQLGLHRKLYTYLTMFVSGSGLLLLQAIADSLSSVRTKTLAPRTLSANPGYDTEVPVNFTGDRMTFGVSTNAVGDGFRLSKMVVTMSGDPWIKLRGRV